MRIAYLSAERDLIGHLEGIPVLTSPEVHAGTCRYVPNKRQKWTCEAAYLRHIQERKCWPEFQGLRCSLGRYLPGRRSASWFEIVL